MPLASPLRLVGPLLLFLVVLAGCGRWASAPTNTSVKSPDGTLTATATVSQSRADPARYLLVIVTLRDASGNVVFQEPTPITDAQKWSIRWVGNDEVVLDSADVGAYHIRRPPGGVWAGELAGPATAPTTRVP
jgi:hypothetical protein